MHHIQIIIKNILGVSAYFRRYTLCILIFTSAIAHGQVLNLYDAISKSVSNYPLIQQRQSEVAASKAHVSTVNAYKLPNLKVLEEFDAGTSNSLPGGYFTFGVIPSVSGSIQSAQNNSIATGNFAVSYLDWPFYTFGYYNSQKRNAEAMYATNQSVLNGDTYLLTEHMLNLYLDWVKKYRLLQIETENLQRSETILNAIKATVQSGLKPGVDSSTANATYARDRISYLQAKDEYTYDLIEIATYTGIRPNNISPDTAVFTYASQPELLQMPVSDSVTITHPLLDVYQKQYEQQLALNKTLSRMYMPKLSLEGAGWVRASSISPTTVYANDPVSGLSYSRYNYLFGVSLSYNISDIKHQHDQIVEGKYYAQAKEDALHTQEINLNKALLQANMAYTTMLEKLHEFPFQLRSAREAYEQQAALYRAGLNTLIDVTNAQYVLKQTEADYVSAQEGLLQLLDIRAGLNGRLDNFIKTFKK